MVVAKRDPKVAVSTQYLAEARRTRRPQHKFNLRYLPYQIQPFMLAPVLPGETITSIMLQSQTWSDPLKGSLKNIGWWQHYNFFYVKHRDLPEPLRTDLAEMMLNPAKDMSAHLSATAWPLTYRMAGGIDFTMECLKHIVSEYFRDEGEDWNVATLNGLPAAQIYGKGTSDAFEKLTLGSEYEDRRVDLDVDGDGAITVDEVNRAYGHWAALRDAGVTEMDYEDFMRTYGSQVRQDEDSPNLHRAEDLWNLREFTYPTNTVEPTTGVPATAVGWRTQKSGGKRIFCGEPGFIIGLTYARPKVYLRTQLGSVAGSMTDVMSWLPAVLHAESDVSHREFAWDEGPFAGLFGDGTTGESGYWLDLRDLLLYGDQFINYDPTDQVPFLDLPTADGTRRYAAEADIRALFTDGVAGNFEQDGITSLSILGRQRETGRNLVLGRS